MADATHIGTLGERSLHAALKKHFAQDGDQLETKVDGYVIDIVRSDRLIEIQTGNFAAMKRKLAKLTKMHHVHVVHPVAIEKWIIKYGPDGQTMLERRKSPQHGDVYDIFWELVSFPHLVPINNFSLEVVLIHMEEIRVNDGQGSWRRRGWSVVDQRLLKVVEQIRLESVDDFRALLPDTLPSPFTTRDIAQSVGVRRNLAGKMAFCLRTMGAIEQVGKQGNAYLYERRS